MSVQAIKSVLGKPAFDCSDVLIYKGDCLDMMRKLPDAVVALTITSPPYNIGKCYETKKGVDEYLRWSTEWLAEIYRVTAPNGALWLNLGYFEVTGRGRAVPISYLLWDRSPFHLLQEIVWNYGAGVSARKTFCPRNEKFLWYVKDPLNYTFNLDDVRDRNVKYPNQKKNGKLKCNPLGKNPGDVWQIPKVTSGSNRSSKERTNHPAQFPIAVLDRILKACSNQGDLVMDPFMGSGSTAEACLRNSRPVFGFEILSNYVESAQHRIGRYKADAESRGDQKKLFDRI